MNCTQLPRMTDRLLKIFQKLLEGRRSSSSSVVFKTVFAAHPTTMLIGHLVLQFRVVNLIKHLRIFDTTVQSKLYLQRNLTDRKTTMLPSQRPQFEEVRNACHWLPQEKLKQFIHLNLKQCSVSEKSVYVLIIVFSSVTNFITWFLEELYSTYTQASAHTHTQTHAVHIHKCVCVARMRVELVM